MQKTIHVVLITLFAISIGYAQSLSQVVVSSAGTTSTGASNTLSFTVGEASIGIITNGESLGQGFWQGAMGAVVSLSTEDFTFEVQTTAFPNPVTNYLNLHFNEMEEQDFTIVLYDNNGKQVFHKELKNSSEDETLNFSTLSQGIYLLKVVQSSTKKSKSFKIIKQ